MNSPRLLPSRSGPLPPSRADSREKSYVRTGTRGIRTLVMRTKTIVLLFGSGERVNSRSCFTTFETIGCGGRGKRVRRRAIRMKMAFRSPMSWTDGRERSMCAQVNPGCGQCMRAEFKYRTNRNTLWGTQSRTQNHFANTRRVDNTERDNNSVYLFRRNHFPRRRRNSMGSRRVVPQGRFFGKSIFEICLPSPCDIPNTDYEGRYDVLINCTSEPFFYYFIRTRICIRIRV